MFLDYISIIFGIIKVYILKLIYCNRIKIGLLLRINRNFTIAIRKGAKLCIGRNCKFRNYIKFRVDNNGIVEIKDNVFLNDNVSINAQEKISIGNGTKIGHNVILIDHDHDYKKNINDFVTKEIFIGNNVWIGANCIILKGCVIPDNCVIAAGTILTEKKCLELESNCLIYSSRVQKITKIERGLQNK